MIRIHLHHVAIAVKSIPNALEFYEKSLGLQCTGQEIVEGEGVKVAFLPVGDARLELLESMREDSAVARFIASRGEGMHHLCFEVPDLSAAIEELRRDGRRILDERDGAEGSRIAFIHPKSAGGVLIELRQAASV